MRYETEDEDEDEKDVENYNDDEKEVLKPQKPALILTPLLSRSTTVEMFNEEASSNMPVGNIVLGNLEQMCNFFF